MDPRKFPYSQAEQSLTRPALERWIDQQHHSQPPQPHPQPQPYAPNSIQANLSYNSSAFSSEPLVGYASAYDSTGAYGPESSHRRPFDPNARHGGPGPGQGQPLETLYPTSFYPIPAGHGYVQPSPAEGYAGFFPVLAAHETGQAQGPPPSYGSTASGSQLSLSPHTTPVHSNVPLPTQAAPAPFDPSTTFLVPRASAPAPAPVPHAQPIDRSPDSPGQSSANSHDEDADLNADGTPKRPRKKRRLRNEIPRDHESLGKYQCQQCNSRFARPSALATHVMTHTKEKPFECTECHRSFAVMSNLRRHCRVRNHTTTTTIHSGREQQAAATAAAAKAADGTSEPPPSSTPTAIT